MRINSCCVNSNEIGNHLGWVKMEQTIWREDLNETHKSKETQAALVSTEKWIRAVVM